MIDKWIPIIAVILGTGLSLIITILAYFMKDLTSVSDNLTKAVHSLEIMTLNIETKSNHINEKVADLVLRINHFEELLSEYHKLREAFYKEYRAALDFYNDNSNLLNEIIFTHKNKHK